MIEQDHRLNEYFVKYSDLVIRNAFSVVKNYEEAEDICQESFARLLVNIEKVSSRTVKAWLLSVSKHLAIDHTRKGGRYKTNVGLEIGEEFFMDETDLFEIMVEKERSANRQIVLRRLKDVNAKWYQAVVMSSLNMSNSEIGERLGASPGLVSQWKHKGRKWLQKAYREEFGDDDE